MIFLEKDQSIIFDDSVETRTWFKISNERDQRMIKFRIYNYTLNSQTSLTYDEARGLARFLMKELDIHEYEANE